MSHSTSERRYRITQRQPVLGGQCEVLYEGPTDISNLDLRRLSDRNLKFDLDDEIEWLKDEGEKPEEWIFVLEVFDFGIWLPLGVFDTRLCAVDPAVSYAWRAEPLPRDFVSGACISSGEHPTGFILAKNQGNTPESFLEAVRGLPYCTQVIEVTDERIIFVSSKGYLFSGSDGDMDGVVDFGLNGPNSRVGSETE